MKISTRVYIILKHLIIIFESEFVHELTLCITAFKLLIKLLEEHNSTTKNGPIIFFKIYIFKGKWCYYYMQYRPKQALSGDFEHACDKIHAKTPLGMHSFSKILKLY